MKKRFLILGLIVSLCILVSCQNPSSGSSNDNNQTDNSKKFDMFDLHFITMENDDFYETTIGKDLIFYEGITQIKGVIVPLDFSSDKTDANGKFVNEYLENPDEYTTEFYVEDRYSSKTLSLEKQSDGTYTFDVDVDSLVNNSTRKYEIRYWQKNNNTVNSVIKNVSVSILSLAASKDYSDCNQYYRNTRKVLLIEKNHYLNGVSGNPYSKDADGNYKATLYYRGIDINNLEVQYNSFFNVEIIPNTIKNDIKNNIFTIDVKIKPDSYTVTDIECVYLSCDGYSDYVKVGAN